MAGAVVAGPVVAGIVVEVERKHHRLPDLDNRPADNPLAARRTEGSLRRRMELLVGHRKGSLLEVGHHSIRMGVARTYHREAAAVVRLQAVAAAIAAQMVALGSS